MSFIYCLPVLLLAVVYRIFRTRQQGSWFSYGFNTAVITLCSATCANALRHQIDSLTGVPNLANLLSHVFLISACVAALCYLDYLIDGRPSPRLYREASWGALLIFTEVVLWFLAEPFQGPESIPDLIYVRDPIVVIYSGIFYAYLLVMTFRLSFGCLAQVTRRSLRRSASLGAIGAGALAESPVIASWLLTSIWPTSLPRAMAYGLHTVGGVGLIVLGLGVLLLALPSSWWRAVDSICLILQVLPLWRLVRRRYPIVALALHTKNPTFLSQRAVIEIQDGLALARFNLAVDASMVDLARAIRRGDAGHYSAMTLFATESSDWRAVAHLGRCYWREMLRFPGVNAAPRGSTGVHLHP